MTEAQRVVTIGHVTRLVEITAGNPSRDATYGELDRVIQEVFGHKLFTILQYIPQDGAVQRVYSSNPAVYPPGGRKQKADTAWGREVLDGGRAMISHNAEDIRRNFPDFEAILGLGIGGMINVPILWGGTVIGSMNVSHDAGHFSDADARPLRLLSGLVAPRLIA
jgi:GAF domain-containing protein